MVKTLLVLGIGTTYTYTVHLVLEYTILDIILMFKVVTILVPGLTALKSTMCHTTKRTCPITKRTGMVLNVMKMEKTFLLINCIIASIEQKLYLYSFLCTCTSIFNTSNLHFYS